MKKILIILTTILFSGQLLQGQNVGIGITTPLSLLSVNGQGDSKYIGYFSTTSTVNGNSALYGQADQPIGFADNISAVVGIITAGRGYARGVNGHSVSPTPSNAGRAYGIVGTGGNATPGANFGLYGQTVGVNPGTAVFGWNRVGYPNGDGFSPTGTVPNINYGGYFIGKGYFYDNVGIGVRDPQYKLDVCGTVHCKEVKVDSVGWCDYVFEEDFELPTLEAEEAFIAQNGHLSSFESAAEMNGAIKVADVIKRQQETIEKLMLHVIALNKEVKSLKNQRVVPNQDAVKPPGNY